MGCVRFEIISEVGSTGTWRIKMVAAAYPNVVPIRAGRMSPTWTLNFHLGEISKSTKFFYVNLA
jgi:hypothetical protein